MKSVTIERTFSVAPMMDWTDRHCRVLHRILTKRALLYTEMITAAAIRYGNRAALLGFSAFESPVALQLGGADPAELALAARLGEEFGYAEINLNCGCPSDRVQDGRFGACLMAEPERVADCMAAMIDAVRIPVTVKCRLGIDDQDEGEPLDRFVAALAAAGCRTFIVHARKAWLKGLSPRQNREIPPLNYERVYRLKRENPGLVVVLNGGVGDLAAARVHLTRVDGVMLGRAAYQQPWLLAAVDGEVFGDPTPAPSRAEVLGRYRDYVAAELACGTRFLSLVKPVMGMFHGEPGGRRFRRILSEPGAGLAAFDRAVAATAGGLAIAAE
jgi:tRNA-dihydrouridine synthase A